MSGSPWRGKHHLRAARSEAARRLRCDGLLTCGGPSPGILQHSVELRAEVHVLHAVTKSGVSRQVAKHGHTASPIAAASGRFGLRPSVTMDNNTGIFWRSELLSRLDRALEGLPEVEQAPRRDPKGLRAAAEFCRKVASRLEAAEAGTLYIVADDLEAEALTNELPARTDVSRELSSSSVGPLDR